MRTPLPSILQADTYDRTTNRVELAKGAVHSYHIAPDSALQVRAIAGALWITLEGDPEDHVLEDGETMKFTGPGLLVAEGLCESNTLECYVVPAVIARWA